MRRSTLAVLAVALSLTGCGTTTVKTVTEHVTQASAPSTTRPTPAPKDRLPATRATRAAGAVASRPAVASAGRWLACDANIEALQPRTSCGFAQNVFYEYWTADGGSPIEVYSPVVGRAFTTRCSGGEAEIRCRTDDGGRVRIRSSALATYSAAQAESYKASHDVGTGSSEVGSDVAADGVDADTGDAGGQNIPNYENGTGYRVQCSDGMYSKSGGRPGACSGHGGVG